MSLALAAAEQQRCEMSLDVPPEFERAVRDRVASGAYASEADVFAACLRALRSTEEKHEAELASLRPLVERENEPARQDEGPSIEMVLDRIRQRMRSANYHSAADVLNDALEALDILEEEEAEKDELRAMIDVGLAELDRGEGLSGEEAVRAIREDVLRITGR